MTPSRFEHSLDGVAIFRTFLASASWVPATLQVLIQCIITDKDSYMTLTSTRLTYAAIQVHIVIQRGQSTLLILLPTLLGSFPTSRQLQLPLS